MKSRATRHKIVAVALAALVVAAAGRDAVQALPVPGTYEPVTARTYGYSGDGGPATAAQVRLCYSYSSGLATDAAGNLYIADCGNHRIRKVDVAGVITTIAGTGSYGYSGDGGPATSARLNWPTGLAVDHSGTIYVADTSNDAVRKIDSSGTITTVTSLTRPVGLAVDSSDRVYVTGRLTVWRIGSDGTLTAIATGLNNAEGVAVDAVGNVYVADEYNYRVLKIDPTGAITTVAGRPPSEPSGPYGCQLFNAPQPVAATNSVVPVRIATLADLCRPSGVAVDANGSVYISDWFWGTIDKIDSRGLMTRLAGTSMCVGVRQVDTAPVAPPTLCELAGLATDVRGNLFFGEAFGGIGVIHGAAGPGTPAPIPGA